MGTTFLWFYNGSLKPIWIYQFKAFLLLTLNQWKYNILRIVFYLESLEKGLTRSQTMHNLTEGKCAQQLCKHKDSPGPWLTSVAAFSKRGKGRGEGGREKGRRVLAAHAHTQCNVPLHDYRVHARPQRCSASEHLALYLHPKTTHASRGAKLPFHCACSKRNELHICPERHHPGIR